MSVGELVQFNLTSPAVLAFVLGALATILRSDLTFPAPVTSILSTYLLLAIGLKGGIALRETSLADIWAPASATVVLGLVTPLVAYAAARRFVHLDVVDSASLAAHYGSVSAVTFTAAAAFVTAAGSPPDGFMPALVAVLEVPGIVVALAIAARPRPTSGDVTGEPTARLGSAIHEVLTGKSVVLLLGGLVVGLVADPSGVEAAAPLFVTLFPGVLVLFLLDLGTLAGSRLGALRAAGPRLVVFAVVVPLVFGPLGVAMGSLAGLSPGGAAVLGAMTASASYIAAPAAVRVGLPDADAGLALAAALGVTFPVNLAIGIPLYAEIADLLA